MSLFVDAVCALFGTFASIERLPMKFILAILLFLVVLGLAFGFSALLGMGLAIVFATFFGIVKPWWVFSIAWVILGSVISMLRGGK